MDTTNSYRKVQELHLIKGIPSKPECQAIFRKFSTNEKIMNNCQAAADFAVKIAICLNRAGGNLDIDLVRAGAMLHDIAKGTSNHAQAGGMIIRELGFPKVAEIVEAHMDLNWNDGVIGEKEVVFLADKLVKEKRFVTLETIFLEAFIQFEQQPQVLSEVRKKLRTARKLHETIESLLGFSLCDLFEEVIRWKVNSKGSYMVLLQKGCSLPL